MSYQLPNYITKANINSPLIPYTWDDRDVDAVLDSKIAEPFITQLDNVGLRAKIALAIGIHEWVIGRFNGLSVSRIPYQIVQAAWCANIDVNYMVYYEVNPNDFMGPVEGPLFVSMNELLLVLYVSDNVYDLEDVGHEDPQYYYSPLQWKKCLNTLIPLAFHILPDPIVFEAWLAGVIKRLVENFSQPDPDPFENLFGQDNNATMLGDLVPREALDLNIEFDKSKTIPLINQYLANVDQYNPLLVPFTELKESIPNPYQVNHSSLK